MAERPEENGGGEAADHEEREEAEVAGRFGEYAGGCSGFREVMAGGNDGEASCHYKPRGLAAAVVDVLREHVVGETGGNGNDEELEEIRVHCPAHVRIHVHEQPHHLKQHKVHWYTQPPHVQPEVLHPLRQGLSVRKSFPTPDPLE